jgi:hypothetical protein
MDLHVCDRMPSGVTCNTENSGHTRPVTHRCQCNAEAYVYEYQQGWE